MKESLAAHVRELQDVAGAIAGRIEHRDWAGAKEMARRSLSAASKLHAQLVVLVEVADDRAFITDALGEPPHPASSRPGAVEGDQPLPFVDVPTVSRTPRGKRGKG